MMHAHTDDTVGAESRVLRDRRSCASSPEAVLDARSFGFDVATHDEPAVPAAPRPLLEILAVARSPER